MMYGFETVVLKRQKQTKLGVTEMKMLRFALGVMRLDSKLAHQMDSLG